MLSQKNNDDLWKLVIFFFNKMIVSKFNYKIYDKELLIIIRVFEKWRSKLKDFKFFIEIISNYKNLEYFMNSRLFNRRQIRWFEFLSKFNFRIIYRFEKQNNAIDALNCQSRIFFQKEKINTFMMQQILKKKNFDIKTLIDFQISFVQLKVSNIEKTFFEKNFVEKDHDFFLFTSYNNEKKFIENFLKLFETSSNIDEKNFENQFQIVCDNNANYQRILLIFRIEESRRIKNFSFVEYQIIKNQIYFRNEYRKLISNNDEFRFRIFRLVHDIFLVDYSSVHRDYEMLQRNYY